jgi:hypothetical protein
LLNRAIAAKPSEAALHNPGKACDLERALPAFDDLQLPAVLAQQVVRELATLVSGIDDLSSPQGKDSGVQPFGAHPHR